MNIGITIITVPMEFRGSRMTVRMVRVRDINHPDRVGVAPWVPEHSGSDMTEEEHLQSAFVLALKRLKNNEA